jgi:hypothetical protein
VNNWTPREATLCAALRSPEEWRHVVGPTAVMGDKRPFAPPAEFWNGQAMPIVGHVTNGDGATAIHVRNALRDADVLTLSYDLAPPAPGSASEKAVAVVAVDNPLPPEIVFTNATRPACPLHPDAGASVSPPQQPTR